MINLNSQAIKPKIEEMSAAMKNVVFLKVDVDDTEYIKLDYEIRTMPTFVFMKKKQKAADFIAA